jgi:hypothetical protein
MIMTLSSLLAERGTACLDESVMIIAGGRSPGEGPGRPEEAAGRAGRRKDRAPG